MTCGTCAHSFEVDPTGPWARGQRKDYALSHIHCKLDNLRFGNADSRACIIPKASPCQLPQSKWEAKNGQG